MRRSSAFLLLIICAFAVACGEGVTSLRPLVPKLDRPSRQLSSTTVFSQAPATTDESQALRSNLDMWGDMSETQQQVADGFTIPTRSQIRQVTWHGFYFQGPDNSSSLDFSVRIYRSLADPPVFDGAVRVTPVAEGSGTFGSILYRFSVDLAGPVLEANTPYHISILDNDEDTRLDFRWLKAEAQVGGDYAIRGDSTSAWNVQSSDTMSDFAFEIEGDPVPPNVLHLQGPLDPQAGSALRSNLLVGAGTAETEQQVGDEFMLPTTANLGRIEWDGFYFQTPLPSGATAVDFTVRLYAALSQPPILDLPVSAAVTQVGTDNFGSPSYRFSATLPSSIALIGNQQYWLVILERDARTSKDFRWYGVNRMGNGYRGYRSSPLQPWFVQYGTSGDFVFTLYAAAGGNQPPNVTLGNFTQNEGNLGLYGAVTLSDPENDFLVPVWDFGDGTPPDTGSTRLHTYADGGIYTVTLRVSDGTNTVTASSQAIIVNVPPVATFTAPSNAIVTGNTFTLSLTNPIDPSPTDVAAGFTYAFDCGSGFGTPSPASSVTCTAGAPGGVTVRGRVADKDGGFSDFPGTVTVTAFPNQAPTASLGAIIANEGTDVSLVATASDPENDPLSYSWDFGDGSTSAVINPVHRWNDNLTYNVRLIVSDGTLADTVVTTATIANVAPTAVLVAPTAPLPQDTPFQLQLTGGTDVSSVDAQSLTYRFNCGAGWGAWTSTASSSCTARSASGNYPVSGAVRDKDGALTTYTRQVTVVNQAPVVTLGGPASITIARGATLNLTATFTDRAGDGPWTARVQWGKGQGATNISSVTPGTPFSGTHVYTKAGTYTVTIEVRDTHNATGAATVTVVVQ